MKLPAGVRDWLPQELAFKREIEERIREVFASWSYAEVLTPTFESTEALQSGVGERQVEQSFRFTDPLGISLALRTEMTTPIARVVSARLRQASLPIRLSYIAPAFRDEAPQLGRMREFTQAGAELIGATGASADAEPLLMALETLDVVGLTDACIDINDTAIVDGVLESVGVTGEDAATCKRLIAARNLVELRSFAAQRDEDFQTVVRLTTMRGRDDVLALVRPLCTTAASSAALARLEEILERVQALGYGDRVNIDFALLRDLQYYTGFVFEGYVADLGFSLCGGGRYDGLLPRFGYDVPAVGWMVGVERVLLALERRHKGVRPRNEVDVLVSNADAAARDARRQGLRVRVDVRSLTRDELLTYARHKNIERVIIGDGNEVLEEVRLSTNG